MQTDILGFENSNKKISKTAKISKSILKFKLGFGGFNSDISEVYYWHINFPYYVGKGYTTLKLEDYHYFSETSQFGQGFRQMKGGSIRAFQENLQQLVQILKVHLLPLIKEIKETDFYKTWLDRIVINDKLIFEENKKSKPDIEKLKKWRKERDEAISHIKDKWVNEIDGGALWRVQRSQQEQGLDFTLTPPLFFGINLPDPFERKQTLKEQLDEYVYDISISKEAKTMVAKFAYRFYTWLPTAIRDMEATYNLKIATAKQFYMQIQMYINFMKPLLLEISKKSEGFNFSNLYRDFENENPEIINLFDYSYSYIKTIGIKRFERSGYKISDLEFSEFGFYIQPRDTFSGLQGYIISEEEGKYNFVSTKKRDLTRDEFLSLQVKKIDKNELKTFPIMELNFLQKRRNQNVKTSQGLQSVPYMVNQVEYCGFCWNLFEIASYRQNLKVKDLELLESFISELSVIKEDIEKYVINVKSKTINEHLNESKSENSKKTFQNNHGEDLVLLTGPFVGLYQLLSPLLPFKFKKKKETEHTTSSSKVDKKYLKSVKMQIAEDTWKVYTINKKAHGHIQY